MSAVRLLSTANVEPQQWLEVRRKGIGGSEIAAIAGVHPYMSPVEAWLRKTGRLPEAEENEAMAWGKRLEQAIADEYAERHPDVRLQRVNAVLQHPTEPIFLGNIDRLVRDKLRGDAVLEIKTTGAYNADQWADSVPSHVICQVQWYLGITGLERGIVAALVGGNRYFEHEMQRDDELIARLQEIGRQFWRHVEDGTMPPADGSEATTEALSALYPAGRPEEIELPPDASALVRQYEEACMAIKQWSQRKDESANKLRQMLGEHERGWVGDRKVCWSNVTSLRLDAKALKEAMPDVYEEFCQPAPSRRFSIK